jgi:hypothetical protein
VALEIEFIDTYSCPHCRAELETGFDRWQGWLRCPACGLAGLPPEPVRLPSIERVVARATVGDDVFVIPDASDRSGIGQRHAPTAPSSGSGLTPARLVIRTGFFVSLALAFLAFLNHQTTNMMILGFLVVVFFLLMLPRPNRRPDAP